MVTDDDDLPIVIGEDWSDSLWHDATETNLSYWDEPTVEVSVSQELLEKSRLPDDGLVSLLRVISDLMHRTPERSLFLLEEAFFGESDPEICHILQAMYSSVENTMRDWNQKVPDHKLLTGASKSVRGLTGQSQHLAETCLSLAAYLPGKS